MIEIFKKIALVLVFEVDDQYPLQCVYSKWGNLENTNQSHCRTKIEKINKWHISQSALGQK